MIDKNECNISEKAKDYLTEKYSSEWEIEASIHIKDKEFCTQCIFYDVQSDVQSDVCNGANSNICSRRNRQDISDVFYKLTDEFKKKLEKDEILTPDFSLAEVGDKVQNLNGIIGKIVGIGKKVKIHYDNVQIGYHNNSKSTSNQSVVDMEGYNNPTKEIKSNLPQWFYGTFKQFPTKENCVPQTREVKAVKKTVAELEKELGYKLEIVSE